MKGAQPPAGRGVEGELPGYGQSRQERFELRMRPTRPHCLMAAQMPRQPKVAPTLRAARSA